MRNFEKTIVKYKVVDYTKVNNAVILSQISRFIGRMEATPEPKSFKDFNKVFGIFLNLKLLLDEVEKRFDISQFDGSRDDMNQQLKDLLKRNGIEGKEDNDETGD